MVAGSLWPVAKAGCTDTRAVNWPVARNLYILAGVLLLFAAISFVMAMTSSRMQPALPANGTLWKTTALFLTVGGLVVALLGVMTAMFEQVDRRTEERNMRRRGQRGPGPRDR